MTLTQKEEKQKMAGRTFPPPAAAARVAPRPPAPPPPPPSSWARAVVATALAALATAGPALLPLSLVASFPPPASAVLSSPNARLPRSADAALRRSIPALNPDVRKAQDLLESVAFKLRIPQRKPWAAMQGDVSGAAALLADPAIIVAGTPPDALPDAQDAAAAAVKALVRVQAAIDAQDPGVTASRLNVALGEVSRLELAQAPGLPFALPRDLAASYPVLTGRATVMLEIVRPRGSGEGGEDLSPQPRPGGDAAAPLARPDGTAARRAGGADSDKATVTLTLDGYSAPVTAGNFAANVRAGVYDGLVLTATPTAVLGGSDIQPDRLPGRRATLPLELLPAGAFDPVYRSPLDVGGGELPVLPLSVYGSLAMSRPTGVGTGEASASGFFLFLYNRSTSGLSGLAFEEGEFSVLGYVTGGSETLSRLRTGDVIKRAVLVDGAGRLVVPTQAAAAAAGAE